MLLQEEYKEGGLNPEGISCPGTCPGIHRMGPNIRPLDIDTRETTRGTLLGVQGKGLVKGPLEVERNIPLPHSEQHRIGGRGVEDRPCIRPGLLHTDSEVEGLPHLADSRT